ncbi:MAG TPA: ribosome maturation factor RimM [Blastocatellia bacterium]|nr:ribosome maturation factor RimM [Blastocatellia bacterium]
MAGGGQGLAGDEDGEVVIARIVKTRGIRGELACDLETEFPERFLSPETIKVRVASGAVLNIRLERHWFHGDRVILKFAGIDSINDAEHLVGAVVVAPAAEWALEEGRFHEHLVLGSRVVTIAGEAVGTVTGLMRPGGTDLLVVETDQGRELLIPFADRICVRVDPGRKEIEIDPPKGLLDL